MLKQIIVSAWDNDKNERIYFNNFIYDNDLDKAKAFARNLMTDAFLKKHYSAVMVEVRTLQIIDRDIFYEEDL